MAEACADDDVQEGESWPASVLGRSSSSRRASFPLHDKHLA
jgi:hypothetical protein